MGETILLALMGTFFGVLLSVPLSFLGARNLMGGSKLGIGDLLSGADVLHRSRARSKC